MSKYSEKLERRREEEAREAAEAVVASRRIVEDIEGAIEALDRAVTHGDAMAGAAATGIAKSEALSIRNSLWATREKLRGMHGRAERFASAG